MKNHNYPWFKRLSSSLAIYYEYVRRLNAIATQEDVTSKQRINDIKILLIYFSEELAEAERNFIDYVQFDSNASYKAIDTRVEHNALGLNFEYYSN